MKYAKKLWSTYILELNELDYSVEDWQFYQSIPPETPSSVIECEIVPLGYTEITKQEFKQLTGDVFVMANPVLIGQKAGLNLYREFLAMEAHEKPSVNSDVKKYFKVKYAEWLESPNGEKLDLKIKFYYSKINGTKIGAWDASIGDTIRSAVEQTLVNLVPIDAGITYELPE